MASCRRTWRVVQACCGQGLMTFARVSPPTSSLVASIVPGQQFRAVALEHSLSTCMSYFPLVSPSHAHMLLVFTNWIDYGLAGDQDAASMFIALFVYDGKATVQNIPFFFMAVGHTRGTPGANSLQGEVRAEK